ncbi:MAG: O-antigen translocase [Gammaproteobacteria bacterium]|nr:O-antigen translocase [Gammaproteobacteria bacterium]MCF6230083.1 O-antigen translocase [Gammaproteobacteria bacterium]
MTLVKTSILSFIATVIKLLAALVINKAVAVYIGPAGLALIGQFQNFTQVVMTFAQGAINAGVTKYTAEYAKDEGSSLSILFSTASKICLTASALVGAGIVLLSNYTSIYFLKSGDHSYIFVIFGFTIILFVLNSLLLSILNGLKEIKTWVSINIIQSIYSLIFTTSLIFWLGLDGALIALVTNQSVVFFIVLWMLRKHQVIKVSNFKGDFNKPEAKKLMAFAAMALTTALTIPISHLIIRNYIGENIGWDEAGYWQAIWYISMMYLMVVTTTLSIYFLPKFSELTDKKELRKELVSGYIIILPIVICMSLGILFFKDEIINILFSSAFLPMKDLFLFQLIGDVIKIAAWLVATLMAAKAMAKMYIVTELIFSLSFVFIAIFMLDTYGLVGITYAFSINYFLYLIVVILLTRKVWV